MTHSFASLAARVRSVGPLIPYLNKSFVSIYKMMGFFLLTVIVGGMFFYLCTSGFYFLNHRWIIPVILTPENDKVIQTRIAYLEKSYQMNTMKSELAALQSETEHYGFVSALQNKFQQNFIKALIAEASDQRKELQVYGKFLKDLKSFHLENADDASKNQKLAASDLEKQYQAGVISREEYMKAQTSLTQMGISRILQKEKLVDLVSRKETLEKTLGSMQQKMSDDFPLSKDNILNFFEVSGANMDLIIKEQPLYASVIAQSEVESKKQPLLSKMRNLQNVIENYEQALRKLENSPFVRAGNGVVTVAFVPYENLERISPDNKVYGCYLEFVFCRTVGKVNQVLSGEVTARHPLSGKELRGQMVELTLAEGMNDWAKSASLVTKKPVFL